MRNIPGLHNLFAFEVCRLFHESCATVDIYFIGGCFNQLWDTVLVYTKACFTPIVVLCCDLNSLNFVREAFAVRAEIWLATYPGELLKPSAKSLCRFLAGEILVRLGSLHCTFMGTPVHKLSAKQGWTPAPVQHQALECIFCHDIGTPSKQMAQSQASTVSNADTSQPSSLYGVMLMGCPLLYNGYGYQPPYLMGVLVEGGCQTTIESCPADYVDCTPYEDPVIRNSKLSRDIHYCKETHSPLPEEMQPCLISSLEDYKISVQWPESLHKIWHPHMPYKVHRGWMKEDGSYFIFPGGGSMSLEGVA